MEGLAVAIQSRGVLFPEGVDPYPRVIRSELEAFMYEYTRTGVRYTAPEGNHDDCVDSLALAVRCRMLRPVATFDARGFDDGDEDDERWFHGAETLDRMWE
jgi:hypothetical protein